MTDPILAVIPARLGSSRLARKPLHPILGRPLLEWVWDRVGSMDLFDEVVVATEAEEVVSLCRRLDAPCVLTDPAHPSGTDRIAEVIRGTRFQDYPIIANVQGDEPLVEEAHLERAVKLVRRDGWEVGTCATPLRLLENRQDPAVVKVARGEDGRALYFSRAAIPYKRDAKPTEEELSHPPFLRHLGIYVYRRAALERWVSLPPSPLEELERLEQLRALENGISIGVAVVEDAGPGVDTAADVVRMEGALARRQSNTSTLTDGT